MCKVEIYHNPRCSKSRQTLALLQEQGMEPEVVLYLETPPDKSTLQQVLAKLGKDARQIIRKNEAEYKQLGLEDTELTESELLDAMVKTPKLIERPIVIKGDKAAIGRPPESVLEIL